MLKGWKIKAIHSRSGHGLEVYLVHDNGYELSISNDKLQYFGYICHGPELGICNNNIFKYTEQEQNDVLIDIISKELYSNYENTIDYHTIRSYLFNERKTILQVEDNAIKRVMQIIKQEFQELYKYKKQIIQKDRIFKD